MADDKKTPVTDDQELAKVLASMNEQAAAGQPPQPAPAGAPAPAPAPAGPPPVSEDIPPIPATLPPSAPPAPAPSTPTPAPAPVPSGPGPAPMPTSAVVPGGLDDIKRQALDELRPIVSKLDLPAEEKFDALLLVIRSSDDQSLIQAAYQAAEGIADEAKKAQALLDIVKEIEYFSSQSKVQP